MPPPYITLDQRTPNLGLKYESDATRNYNWAKLDDIIGKCCLEALAMADQAYAKLIMTANQTIPTGVTTVALNFQQAQVNVGGMYTATQPDRLTIQLSGFYVAGAYVGWEGKTGGLERDVGLSVNDVQRWDFAAVSQAPPAQNLSWGWGQSITGGGVFSPGDRLHLVVYQDSGGPLFVDAAFTAFWLIRVGAVQ